MKLISFMSLTLFFTLLNSTCFAEAQSPKLVPTLNTEYTTTNGGNIRSGQPYNNASGKQYMCQKGTLVLM